MATAAGFQGGLPPSLLSVALQNGGVSPPAGGSDRNTIGNLPPSILFGEPSQFSDYTALADTLLSLDDFPQAPSVVMVNGQDFQELDDVPLPPSPPPLSDDPELDRLDLPTAVLQDTRVTTELTTAITNFINNLADAITQLLTDLQAAITANPAVALLLLLPLLLLPFLFHKGDGGGYGGGGGYHRRVYHLQGRALVADTLTQLVLTDIERLERLFRSQDSHWGDAGAAPTLS